MPRVNRSLVVGDRVLAGDSGGVEGVVVEVRSNQYIGQREVRIDWSDGFCNGNWYLDRDCQAFDLIEQQESPMPEARTFQVGDVVRGLIDTGLWGRVLSAPAAGRCMVRWENLGDCNERVMHIGLVIDPETVERICCEVSIDMPRNRFAVGDRVCEAGAEDAVGVVREIRINSNGVAQAYVLFDGSGLSYWYSELRLVPAPPPLTAEEIAALARESGFAIGDLASFPDDSYYGVGEVVALTRAPTGRRPIYVSVKWRESIGITKHEPFNLRRVEVPPEDGPPPTFTAGDIVSLRREAGEDEGPEGVVLSTSDTGTTVRWLSTQNDRMYSKARRELRVVARLADCPVKFGDRVRETAAPYREGYVTRLYDARTVRVNIVRNGGSKNLKISDIVVVERYRLLTRPRPIAVGTRVRLKRDPALIGVVRSVSVRYTDTDVVTVAWKSYSLVEQQQYTSELEPVERDRSIVPPPRVKVPKEKRSPVPCAHKTGVVVTALGKSKCVACLATV